MFEMFSLEPGKMLTMPLPQRKGYKIVAIKFKRRKGDRAIYVIPVYKKDRPGKRLLTDFNLN